MEPDGRTRVWANLQNPELFDHDGVCEKYPIQRDLFYDAVTGEEAEEIRSQAEAAYRLRRGGRDDIDLLTFIPRYWVEIVVIETGEVLTMEDSLGKQGPYLMAEAVANLLEGHLGKRGLTILSGGKTGFDPET